MLKKLATGLAVSMFIFFCVPFVVNAQEGIAETTNIEPIQEATTSVEPAMEISPKTTEGRVKSLKEKAKGKISAAEEKRITAKCAGAQKIVSNLQTKMNTVIENRREKYSIITSKLQSLVEKLQIANVDTAQLESVIMELDVDIATSIALVEAYETSLSDLATIDCEADPVAFKVLLDAIREQRKEIISSHGSLKSRINETVKPVIQAMRESIQPSNATGEGEDQ